MRRLLLTIVLMAGGGVAVSAQSLPRVVFRTDRGDIEAEIDTVRAPITGKNFLRYVDGGFFTGGTFFRTVRADNQPTDSIKIGVIQAAAGRDRRGQGFPPIPLETTKETGIRHLDGTLSMGRAAPVSATSSFFICVGAQPALDFGGMRNTDGLGFAAFGRVTRGMDVVRAIQSAPADGQNLKAPVVIHEAKRLD